MRGIKGGLGLCTTVFHQLYRRAFMDSEEYLILAAGDHGQLFIELLI